jgi:hypothetical protein
LKKDKLLKAETIIDLIDRKYPDIWDLKTWNRKKNIYLFYILFILFFSSIIYNLLFFFSYLNNDTY